MCFVLMLIGVLNVWTDRPSVGLAQAVLTLLWTFIFQLSAGQFGWALPAEMGSTHLRQKTICLARNTSKLTGTIEGTLQQYFMNPQAWNLKGYTGYDSSYYFAPITLLTRKTGSSGEEPASACSCGPTTAFQKPGTDTTTNSTSFSPRKCLPATSPRPLLTHLTSTRITSSHSNTKLRMKLGVPLSCPVSRRELGTRRRLSRDVRVLSLWRARQVVDLALHLRLQISCRKIRWVLEVRRIVMRMEEV